MSKKLDCKIKRLRNLKISIIIIVTLIFVLSLGCEKAPVIEQQEEKGQETVSSETTETGKETIKGETLPVVEETPEEIEWEGVVINPIEGLRFDNGTFFAEVGNPYGLETETKAGVFVKDAVEINGVMENSIALRPEVIEFLQKKALEEEEKFLFPLPIDSINAKGVKINEVKYIFADQNPDFNETALAILFPLGSKIYASLTTETFGPGTGVYIVNSSSKPEDGWYGFEFIIADNIRENIYFEGLEHIDSARLGGQFQGAILSQDVFPEEVKTGARPTYKSVKVGTPLAQIISPPKEDLRQFFSDFCSMELSLSLKQVKFGNTAEENKVEKYINTVKGIILQQGDIKISILPAND